MTTTSTKTSMVSSVRRRPRGMATGTAGLGAGVIDPSGSPG
jgi:hypothetical protein